MDDQPRDEFSPRQRHTLKEFAVCSPQFLSLYHEAQHFVGSRDARNGTVER